MAEVYSMNDYKPLKFTFDESFIHIVNESLDTYHNAFTRLKEIVGDPENQISDMYGICNNGYAIRYIRPHDISTFVSYILKATNMMKADVGDLEKICTEFTRQCIADNPGCIPFEDSNAYATGTYVDTRNQTLDDLIILCKNAWYDTDALSKSDMIQRAKTMNDDIAIMDKLNFVANIRKLVSSIPDIINKDNMGYIGGTQKTLVKEYIQKFIVSSIMINLSSIEQMLGYCIPNTGYNVKRVDNDPNRRMDYDFYGDNRKTLSDGIVTETIDTELYSPVMIVLSTDKSLVSTTIRFFSGGDYSHASISFDKDMHMMYTFNGGPGIDDIYPEKNPGMQKESLYGTKFKDRDIVIYCLFLKNDIVNEMQKTCDEMYEKGDAKYSYSMIVKKIFHSDRGNSTNDRYICSSFVNEIISMCGKRLVEKNIPSPYEMSEAAKTNPDMCLKLYSGKGGEFDYDDAMENIEEFVKDNVSKPFVESYYTECSLLRTNEMRIRSKIPFNCNMRDIVLQDMHPDFKDTESAIKFMLHDSRSPIASLVCKYATVSQNYPGCNGSHILHMFMKYRPKDQMNYSLEDVYRKHNEVGMHTDVNWLDKITYGNMWLDGNYRSDAVGNNHFNPFENTLDTLYRMYSCCDKKTNEDLANNIIEVSNVMSDIIRNFRRDRPDDWDTVRDILAVLGEILTRAMLKLYHNNTLICVVSDNMPDAGGPAYLYNEYAYFSEANENAMKVEIKDAKGTVQSTNIKGMLSKLMAWLQTQFANISNLFGKNHKAEIDWINKNKDLNAKIDEAIKAGTFNVTLTNAPDYNINAAEIKNTKVAETVKKYIDSNNGVPDQNALIKEMLPSKLAESYEKAGNDQKAQTDAITNFILYNGNQPQLKNGAIDTEYWNSLLDNLTKTMPLLKEVTNKLSEDIKAGITEIEKHGVAIKESMQIKLGDTDQLYNESDEEMQNPNSTSVTTTNESDNKAKTNAEAMASTVVRLSNVYGVAVPNIIQKKVYGDSYKLYQSIVTGFKQQQSKQSNQQTPEIQSTNVNNQQ